MYFFNANIDPNKKVITMSFLISLLYIRYAKSLSINKLSLITYMFLFKTRHRSLYYSQYLELGIRARMSIVANQKQRKGKRRDISFLLVLTIYNLFDKGNQFSHTDIIEQFQTCLPLVSRTAYLIFDYESDHKGKKK